MRRLVFSAALSLAAISAPAWAADLISAEGLRATPSTLTVASATASRSGYLVVHETSDGKTAGTVIGQKAINPGENENVSIPLEKRLKPGAQLIVMMHTEDNDDTEFDSADKPVMSGKGPVQQVVTIE